MSDDKKIVAKIEVIEKEKHIDGPILADFRGRIRNDTTFQGYTADKTVHENIKYPKYVLRGQSDSMIYQCTEKEEEGSRYLLGVYNKKEKKLKLISCQEMEAQQRPVNLLNLSSIQENENFKAGNLFQDFGNRKIKTQLSNRLKNVVQVDLIKDASASIQAAIENKVEVKDEDEKAESSEFASLLPYYDSTTTKLQFVYPLARMVDIELLNSIDIGSIDTMSEEECSKIIKTKNSGFLKFRVNDIFSAGMEYDKEALKYVLYIDYLMSIYSNKKMQKAENANVFKTLFDGFTIQPSLQLLQFILDTFAEKITDIHGTPNYFISSKSKLKIAIHCLILCLHFNDYDFPLEEFAKQFDVKPLRARMIARGIGCVMVPNLKDSKKTAHAKAAFKHYKSRDEKNYITLHAPLKLAAHQKNVSKKIKFTQLKF
ncbi:hypothetical protein K502DRAFT_369091, partial [Neoconidiobolus thromboides FSU 785]